jgi:hypothetical protein
LLLSYDASEDNGRTSTVGKNSRRLESEAKVDKASVKSGDKEKPEEEGGGEGGGGGKGKLVSARDLLARCVCVCV